MIKFLKKVIRTAQVSFPVLQDTKFAFKRMYQSAFKVPCEDDFYALPLIKGVEKMFFLDIGANRGETIRAIRLTARTAKIEGFEPNPIVYNKTKNLYKNDPHVTLHNVGIGDGPGLLELNIPFYKKFMFDGLASFDEAEAMNWLQTRIFFFKKSNLKIEKVSCKIVSLDSYNLSPDFIKIDVQGFEYKVLEGAQATIARSKPIFLIETPTEEVSQFLKNLGYTAYKYEALVGLTPGQGSLNTYFFDVEKHGPFAASKQR